MYASYGVYLFANRGWQCPECFGVNQGSHSVGDLNESRSRKLMGNFRLICLAVIGDSNHLR